jgi:ornithine--oxo-acid transaminase
MAYNWDGIKPDLVAVGKATSGGVSPVSGVFCNDKIMLTIKPGEHGSTFGGNPFGMHIAKVAIQALVEEGMPENALKIGNILQDKLGGLKSRLVKEVRGKGLFLGLELIQNARVDGNDLALAL